MVRAARRLGGRRVVADVFAWMAAGLIFTGVLVALGKHPYTVALAGWAVATGSQLAGGHAFGLYRGRARLASFEEIPWLAMTSVLAGILGALLALLIGHRHQALAFLVIATPIAITGELTARAIWRERRERPLRRGDAESAPLIVFGAGEGGYQVIRAMLRKPQYPYRPVALVDDDPRKRHLRLMGIPVEGDRRALADIARRTGAQVLLIAIPSAKAELVREITDASTAIGLRVKVLPGVSELADGRVGISDIRDLRLEDLLGRRSVGPELEPLNDYVRGKRVLVTGAGGSIGSELCRVLAALQPAQLLLLDRDESALHAVHLSIEGQGLLDSDSILLADIRDERAIRRIFHSRRPQVVFHAAALKHLPLLERYPGEATQTNVRGTLTVLQAASEVAVERFVNISTDKAAAPISVLGYSKRIGERLTSAFAASSPGTYVSVRFGNVLGSRGSVLTTFTAQAAAGGPLTVTDPEVTRYFMTVGEAVRLVVAAGGAGRSGEVLVLDMGEPVRIADVAARVAAQIGQPADIVYTGLRPGEKLHETLFSSEEQPTTPIHPLIRHVDVPALHPQSLDVLDPELATSEHISQLGELATSISLDAPRSPASVGIRLRDAGDASRSSGRAVEVGG